jgi:hypothetical protein
MHGKRYRLPKVSVFSSAAWIALRGGWSLPLTRPDVLCRFGGVCHTTPPFGWAIDYFDSRNAADIPGFLVLQEWARSEVHSRHIPRWGEMMKKVVWGVIDALFRSERSQRWKAV